MPDGFAVPVGYLRTHKSNCKLRDIRDMKEQNFMTYETPQVELIEVEVEQGFAASGGATGNTQGFREEDGAW